MSLESTGADYLRRLRRDLEDPPAFESQATSAPAEPEVASERRQNPRYKCAGSAQFRVKDSDVRTWGTLTDLSTGGCYVEMTATFPVGSTVDLVLELNGVRAQVKGEVRVSYPCLGMGIAFREVSDEDRIRLHEMVRSLRPAAPEPQEAHAVELDTAPISLPIIVNVGAALQALVDYFERHTLLTKEEFIQVLRKSQSP
jgi:hypothetical protein